MNVTSVLDTGIQNLHCSPMPSCCNSVKQNTPTHTSPTKNLGENRTKSQQTQISRLFLPILIHSLQFDSALKRGELPIVRLLGEGVASYTEITGR